jgi:hypothetical protein
MPLKKLVADDEFLSLLQLEKQRTYYPTPNKLVGFTLAKRSKSDRTTNFKNI